MTYLNSEKKSTKFSTLTLFTTHFSSIEDPRRINKGNFQYPLEEILFLTISSVISGFSQYTEIRFFGVEKLNWLKQFFSYENGIPSTDVLERVFANLDNESFGEAFTNWILEISGSLKGENIAIDGKTARGSSSDEQSAIHIVSAFATKNKLTLAQKVVEEKSNEIVAIPKLLDLLMIKGTMITSDAMGCQTDIVEKIRDKKADYTLMVKGNQKALLEQCESLFESTSTDSEYDTIDLDHGRLEKRNYQVIEDLIFLDEKEKWQDLKSVIKVGRKVIHKKSKKETFQTSYYISSGTKTAEEFSEIIRGHWSIENHLHWSLDVLFKEDSLLKKKGNSAKNFNIIKKIALSLIEKQSSGNGSRHIRMNKCALNDDFRQKTLGI